MRNIDDLDDPTTAHQDASGLPSPTTWSDGPQMSAHGTALLAASTLDAGCHARETAADARPPWGDRFRRHPVAT